MVYHLKRRGGRVGRKRVRRLMAKMGLAVIYQKPRTSRPHPENRVYPYLLRGLAVTRPDQVWCTDVTYIPMRRGFLYLVAIMDWYSRWVLSWRLSNTLEPSFCCEALEEALNRYDPPEIFNTDQGSQFTSTEFTGDRIDSSKIELMSDRCLIKNRTENLMRRRRIEEEEVEFGVAPRVVDTHRRGLRIGPQRNQEPDRGSVGCGNRLRS